MRIQVDINHGLNCALQRSTTKVIVTLLRNARGEGRSMKAKSFPKGMWLEERFEVSGTRELWPREGGLTKE